MTIGQEKNVPIETFGGRVKFIRESNGLTQTQFAEKIGVQPSFISKVERDATRFTIDHIVLIKTIFSFDANWLLTGEGEMKRPEPVVTAGKLEGLKPLVLDADRRRGVLHDKLQRVLDEGDKVKVEAIKGMLKAFDPGEK